ncbi:MAG: DUF262 domain-containing protein [Methylocella sp.]
MEAIFETNPVFLSGLLGDLKTGKIQLPDFQRGWVWNDERIRGVLASVSRSFPIGALMVLETGGETQFHPRPVEGVDLPKEIDPELLVLDGQQRLTSLFQATTYGKVVATMNVRKQPIKRWFYFDMVSALASAEDREEAIIGVPENRIVRTLSEVKLDLSTREREFEELHFPCEKLFDTFEWQNGYLQYWKFDPAKTELFMRFQAEVLQRFQSYQVPVIKLKKAVKKEAVCHVFEKVNTGGVVLNTFELLTATYAADNFRLRDDWYGSAERKVAGAQPAMHTRKVLRGVQNTDFLQAITLISTYHRRQEDVRLNKPQDEIRGVSCKGSAVLALRRDDYQALRDHVLTGFLRAAKFLTLEHIFLNRDLPYQTQLVALAAILAELGDRWEEIGTKQKVRQWYWCGVLGELYGGAVESRHARDLPEVLAWIRDGATLPTTVRDSNFNPDRLLTLRTRNSAAYKGIYALLIQSGAREFLTDEPISFRTYEEEKIDIHHIFPQDWCKRNEIERKRMDCIINKTAISSGTNRSIGGVAPSKYLLSLEKRGQIAASKMVDILSTHLISCEALRADNFEAFFEARRRDLLDLIGKAMGKTPVAAAELSEPTGEPVDDEDDTDDNMEIVEAQYGA